MYRPIDPEGRGAAVLVKSSFLYIFTDYEMTKKLFTGKNLSILMKFSVLF